MNTSKINCEIKKDDAQRLMVWCCLFGMLLYPFLVIFTEFLQLTHASSLIATMANLYFVTTSAIIMTYFGANAITKIKNEKTNREKQTNQNV